MSFGDTSVLDTFTGTGGLGANWTTVYGSWTKNGTAIPGAANSFAYWNPSTFSATVEAYATVSTKPGTGGEILIAARMKDLGSIATIDGYGLRATNNTGTDTIALVRIDNAASTVLTSTSREFSAGDKLGISCIGSTIKGYHYSGGAWTEVLSTTDSTYAAAGNIAMSCTDTTGRLDDFGGGIVITNGTSTGSKLLFSASSATGTVDVQGTSTSSKLLFSTSSATGTVSSATTTVIDDVGTNGLPLGDNGSYDTRLGQSFDPPVDGNLTEFTVYINTIATSTDVNWALCDDNAGIPGTQLVTGSFTPTAGADNVVSVTGSPVLQNGTTYWITLEVPVGTAADYVYSSISNPYASGLALWDVTFTATFPGTWDYLTNTITDLRMAFTVELLPVEGAGSGTLTFSTSSATGTVLVQGTGSSTLLFSTTATGTVDVQGASSSTLLFSTSSATGTVLVQGGGSATLLFSATATGTVEVQGASASTLLFSSTAEGILDSGPIEGSGSAILLLSTSATGTVSGVGDTTEPYADWGFYVDWDGDGDFSESYENITTYVRQANWRLGMRNMFQALADKTECTLLVKNHDGRFSPENGASPYAGEFLPGRLMEIRCAFDGTTRTMWRGFLESVSPFGANKRQPDAEIKGTDLKGFAQKIKVSIPLLENVTADTALRQLFSQVQPPPGTWSGNWLIGKPGFSEIGVTTYFADPDDFYNFETGVVTHPYVGDRWADGVDVYRAALDIVGAELGRLFTGRDGKLYFWNWEHLSSLYTTDETIDNTMIDTSYAYGQDIFNVVKVVTTPRKISANSDDVLWTQEDSITIKPGDEKIIRATFKDDSGADIAATEVQTPTVGVGTLAHTGTITLTMEAKARNAEIKITNTGADDAEISTLIVKGKKLSSFNRREIIERDETSVGVHGELELNLATELLSDEVHAKRIARYELARRKDPRGVIYSITLQNSTVGMYNIILANGMGNRINVVEDVLYHDANYAIIGEDHRLSEATKKHTVSWTLEIADTRPVWLIGVVGRSEIGETTYFGF